MVSVLIAARADPNAKNPGGMTALMFATQTNQISAIKLLIEHGADVNARTPSGSSAIKYAAVMGRPGLVKLLIAMDAKKQDLKLLSPAAQEMLPLILKVNSREGSSSRELWQDVGERMEETLRMVKNPNVLLARQVIVLMAVSNFQSIFEKHPQLTHERLFEVACMFGNVVNVNAHYLMLHKDSQGGALIEKPGLDIDDTSANIPSN